MFFLHCFFVVVRIDMPEYMQEVNQREHRIEFRFLGHQTIQQWISRKTQKKVAIRWIESKLKCNKLDQWIGLRTVIAWLLLFSALNLGKIERALRITYAKIRKSSSNKHLHWVRKLSENLVKISMKNYWTRLEDAKQDGWNIGLFNG